MEPESHSTTYSVRFAEEPDLAALGAMRPPESLYRTRLSEAANGDIDFLLVQRGSDIVGFGLLVFRRPESWKGPLGQEMLPGICDLWVRPESRSQGAGSFLVNHMAKLAKARGCSHLYIGGNPEGSPRSYALYLRLGFVPIQAEPHEVSWSFTDSAGVVHEGSELNVDMLKEL